MNLRSTVRITRSQLKREQVRYETSQTRRYVQNTEDGVVSVYLLLFLLLHLAQAAGGGASQGVEIRCGAVGVVIWVVFGN